MKSATFALAEAAYLARRADEIQALEVELRRAQAKIAAEVRATGAPGYMMAEKLGVDHVRQQCRTAAEELMRACTSTGERPTRANMQSRWSQMIDQTRSDAEAALTDFLIPHSNAGATSPVARFMDSATLKGQAIVYADFAHFVAEQNRAAREKRWKVAAWFGAAFAGAFLAKSPDIFQWILHH